MTSTAVHEGPAPADSDTVSAVDQAAPPAFAAVYAAHVQTVARWAARLGGPQADVEDITQEVFVVVSRRLGEFRGQSRISTWLFGITARITANERRRRRLRQWWFRLVPNAGERAESGFNAGFEGPVEELEKRERRALFHRALDRISERQRRALVLFELEELSIEEVAALMELRPGNVRVLLHRARAAFSKSMIDCELEQALAAPAKEHA